MCATSTADYCERLGTKRLMMGSERIKMDKAEVIQVIRTTLLRRGDGKEDPIRIIEQFWSLDGQLLAENDPIARGT